MEINKYLSYLSSHSQYFKKTTHMKTLSAVFFIAFIVFSTKVHSQVNVESSANALNVINREGLAKGGNPNSEEGFGYYRNSEETYPTLRGGTLYGGVMYKGQAFFYGHNSENRLHKIQNFIHRNWPIRTSQYFQNAGPNNTPLPSKSYKFYGGYHPNFLFY